MTDQNVDVRNVDEIIASTRRDERQRQWHGLHGKWVSFQHSTGVWFRLCLGDSVAMSIVRSSDRRDDAPTKFILSRLTKGGVFLDVGANAGWFTLRAADRYRSLGSGKSIGFEPQLRLFDELKEAVRFNDLGGHAEVRNVALGDHDGEVWMIDAGLNSGGSYVTSNQQKSTQSAVALRRFDELYPDLNRVDFIKIDVEGSEPLFFKGASKFFAAQRPLIYSEINERKLNIVSKISGADYVRQVEALGYKTRKLAPDGSLLPMTIEDVSGHQKGGLNVVFEPV